MKNKKLWIIVALLILVVICGETVAYMRKQSNTLNNNFVPAIVTCQVEETYQNNEKTNIQVRNTSNVDAYLRVRLVSYWMNSKGEILYKASPTIKFSSNDSINTADWIAVDSGDNDNSYTYYYTKKVKPGDLISTENLTTNLLKSGSKIILETDTKGNRQVIDVIAEAIQADTEIVVNAWNVTIENGIITGVKN